MDCRTPERREWIVNNYNVIPVAYVKLLAGQSKHSDAGKTITDKYYIFHAYPQLGGEKKIIQCGMGAARHLLDLIGHGGQGGRRPKEIWDPIAQQLYNAIMWVIVIIDADPNTKIFEIREKVYKYKDRAPFNSQVKGVNTIIERNLRGKTLTEAIDELRADNNVRDNMCQFDLLIEIINNYTDKDGNHIEIASLF